MGGRPRALSCFARSRDLVPPPNGRGRTTKRPHLLLSGLAVTAQSLALRPSIACRSSATLPLRTIVPLAPLLPVRNVDRRDGRRLGAGVTFERQHAELVLKFFGACRRQVFRAADEDAQAGKIAWLASLQIGTQEGRRA